MIKMLSGIKKSFFPQISAVCIGVCAYMHTTFLVGEIADRFVGQAQYTGNISSLTKNRQSVFFCLLSKEMWICFNHNIVWHLLHGRPFLCLNLSSPSHFVFIFKIDPPKIKPLRKLYPAAPHWDVINDRSLKQRNRNHEQDHADFSLSRKQRNLFALRHLCPVHELLTTI